MRTLTIADNWKDWKFGDTDAVMTFTALDDDKVPDFSNRTLTFKIASTLNNDLEHPKDFAATATGYIQDKNVILKTEDVKQLTPGNYIVELWAMSNDTQKDAVYPSKGFAQFTIEENSMKVSDVTNIPSMTINAFWNAVMQKVRTLTKGAKGDPGKTPKIVIGSVTKLSPDAQPSATLVPLQSDPNTYTLNLQLPQGVQGEQGLQGIPGVGSKGLDGNNGLTPTIDPKTKHWMIGGTDTGVIAEGQAGKDADPSKYVTIVSFNQLRQQVQSNATALAQKAGKYELEDKLAKMNLQPEMYADLEAVKAAYPNGATKLIATDDGYLALYRDGQWVKGPLFQAAGIEQSLIDGDNFISNGSFTTGKTDPAIAMNNDTQLAVTDHLGRKWLQITGVGNSSMRGAQWIIEGSDKVTTIQNYPLQLSFDIQSSVAQTFNVDIHFMGSDGQDMNNSINIGQISLSPWELFTYRKTINLGIGALTGISKVVIMLYSNNTGDLGTVLLTGLKVNVKFNDNALPGASLLPKEPWTANNNSRITTTTHLGEEWHSLTTSVAGTGQGYQWVIDDTDKISLLPYYPLRLSFNINSLTVSQLFNIDVHFYDKNGNDLNNSYTIDSLQADAGSFIHYDKEITFNFSHLQNVAKIALILYSTNAEDVGTVLLNHESALLQFKTNQLKGPELIDGQPFPNNGETVISTTKYLEQEWLKMTSTANTQFRGLQWQIDNKDKIFLMATYPIKFNFNIQSSIAQTLKLDIHFYDKNGNDLGNSISVDQIALNAWELLNYQKEITLDYDHIKDATKVVLMLYTSGTNDLGIVLINDYNAVLEYNTNKKSNSASSHDYKQLPEVYLNGSTSGMSGNNYVTMQFKYKDNGREVDGFASTKWQGDSSLAFNKKAYRIKTFEDQSLTKKMKFKPNPLWDPDNKYNLKAYYTDPLLCRDVVNANIGTDIWSTQKNMPNDLIATNDFGFIDGFPVKVFVNNEFAGIYSFNTAKGDYGKQAKAVISGETYTDPTAFSNLPAGGVKLDGSDFEMISPDEPTDEIKQATNDLITFVSTSSDDDFKAQLSQHIDLESLIDYFIFLNVIENSDAAGKNQTLITWDLKKWYFHPYDLDTTYGVDSNGNISEPLTDLLGLNSHLFTRLNSLFADEIKARYKELRTWLTPVYVLKMYRDHINLIGEANYEDEFKLWDNPNHDKDTYNFLKKHVYKRFKLLDNIWK